MNIFNRVWLVSTARILLLVMLVILFIALYFYWDGEKDSKITMLLGGVSTGLFLVIIQFMFSWGEHIERDRHRLLGLKKVLENKKDPVYYGKLIRKAKRRIDVMGKTCHHFLEDFANKGGTDKEANLLFEALSRDVAVRILLPTSAKNDKNEETIKQIEELKNTYNNFSCKYFDYPECHSIFVADSDVILGPFFPGTKSMNTPALHVEHDAVLSKRYLEYFNEVWDNAQP